MEQPDNSIPVTVSIARKVRPGAEEQYEDWLRRLTKVALNFPGHQGVHILKPSNTMSGEYVLIVGFDSYMHQRIWEQSSQRKQFIDELESEDWIVGSANITKVPGSEFWFQLPQPMIPAHPSPKLYKMALVLFVVVFSLLMAINYTFSYWLAPLALPVKFAIMVAGQVFLMTYFVMPNLMRKLGPWLSR